MKQHFLYKFFTALTFFVLSGSISLFSYSDTTSQARESIFDVLCRTEVAQIRITAQFDTIKSNIRNKEEFDGVFEVKDESGEWDSYNINLSLRGKYRRMFSENIPPLKIDFSKKELRNNNLKEFDDMKLVTLFHKEKGEAYQTLIKEYLSYKIFNLLSGYSYRVQLAEIEYIDATSGAVSKEYGFFIEDSDQLAERIGGKEIKNSDNIDTSNLHRLHTDLVSTFQYMIGNGDWSLLPSKNIDLFEVNGKIYPIPYDFDFAGLVNADYAVPNNAYQISSVKDRIYLGIDDNLEKLNPVIRMLDHKQKEILQITESCKLLSRKDRKETTDYLKSYYAEMEIRVKNNLNLNDTLSTLVLR